MYFSISISSLSASWTCLSWRYWAGSWQSKFANPPRFASAFTLLSTICSRTSPHIHSKATLPMTKARPLCHFRISHSATQKAQLLQVEWIYELRKINVLKILRVTRVEFINSPMTKCQRHAEDLRKTHFTVICILPRATIQAIRQLYLCPCHNGVNYTPTSFLCQTDLVHTYHRP